ncbi:MAG: class I SAM-dependent methyltransferase [Chloroflexi bacterium]|nr:MAG: class I SAM-dependent methyltransferase [Chloroflexota bacterium]
MTSDSLRSTFNSAADDYNRIRPGYPDQVFADIVSLSGIPQGGAVLEIGCGTGQATLPLARLGYPILCLDIGPNLLAIAAENLRAYPEVRFHNIAFEQWPVEAGHFDLVFSATAFHWIPPEIGYAKSALALKPGGALAVFSNQQPLPPIGFFDEVQPVYRRLVPEWKGPAEKISIEREIQAQVRTISDTQLFRSVIVRTYPWSQTYTTDEYLRLLSTYSDHIQLEDNRRRGLYQAIGDLIEQRYGGLVERPYLTVLYLSLKYNNP